MTKENFAQQIIETIENCDESEKLESVLALIDILVPRDRSVFAKWGFPKDQSTEKECWI